VLINADNLNVTFKNCLFDNCDFIIDGQNKPFGVITFEKCTIYRCKKIGELKHSTTGSIEFKRCIIYETPLLNTNRPVTFVNAKKSIINSLFGIDASITYNDTIISNPMMLMDDNYKLMSKSRGYDYDSVALDGVGYSGTYETPTEYTDCGVWNEKRASKTVSKSTWIVAFSPQVTKGLKYFNKNDYEDYDGVKQSVYEKVIETIELDFDKNGLTEADVEHCLLLLKSQNNEVIIYPDSSNNSAYYKCKFNRPDKVKYKKENVLNWDVKRNLTKQDLLKGFMIEFSITEKVGITNV